MFKSRIWWSLIAWWCGFVVGFNAHAGPPLLDWGPPSPGATYRVYVSRVPGAFQNAEDKVDMGSDTLAYVPELPVGEPMWFQVTSIVGGWESDPSNEVGYIKPFVSITPSQDRVRFWFYRVPESAGNLKYTIELSKDLKTWSDEHPFTPHIESRDGLEIYIIDVPTSDAPHMFARIRVTEQ